MSAVSIKLEVGLTPVHCGHTYVQAGWSLSTVDGRLSNLVGQASVHPGHLAVQADIFLLFYHRRS